MEIITGGNTSIFAGSDEITKVYQGSGLIWEKNESPAPAWPKNYFYPSIYSLYNSNGISFWKSSLTSGQTYTLDAHRTSDEGSGYGFWQIEPKSGNGEAKPMKRLVQLQLSLIIIIKMRGLVSMTGGKSILTVSEVLMAERLLPLNLRKFMVVTVVI